MVVCATNKQKGWFEMDSPFGFLIVAFAVLVLLAIGKGGKKVFLALAAVTALALVMIGSMVRTTLHGEMAQVTPVPKTSQVVPGGYKDYAPTVPQASTQAPEVNQQPNQPRIVFGSNGEIGIQGGGQAFILPRNGAIAEKPPQTDN